jgi:hypothetical protein
LTAHRLVSNRLGILELLAALATDRSYRVVHGNLLNEPDLAEPKPKALELAATEGTNNSAGAVVASPDGSKSMSPSPTTRTP